MVGAMKEQLRIMLLATKGVGGAAGTIFSQGAMPAHLVRQGNAETNFTVEGEHSMLTQAYPLQNTKIQVVRNIDSSF